jgi:predicted MFS family arabinose efflux permease
LSAPEPTGSSRTGYREVFAAPRAKPLLSAFGVSYLGDAMSAVSIAWLAIEISAVHNRSLFVGAAVAAYSLPGVIGAFAFARFLRRRPTRMLVVADCVLRATLFGSIFGLRAAHALSPATYIALLAFSSLLSAWGVAGRYTVLAELVGPDLTLAANSLQSALQSTTIVIGPGIAGVLVGVLGAGPLIGLDALSYLLLAVVAFRRPPVRVGVARLVEPEATAPVGRAPGGIGLLRRHGLIGLVALTWLFDFLYGPVEVALPLHVSLDLHRGAGLLGLYWALFGAGAAIGSLAAGRFKNRAVWPIAVAIIAGWGLCLVPFGFGLPTAVTVATFGLGGLIYGPYVPLTYVLIQSRVPLAQQAVVLAAEGAVMTVAAPLGTALGGPLTAAFGASRTIAGSGVATVLAAVVIGVATIAWPRRGNWKHAAPEPPPS